MQVTIKQSTIKAVSLAMAKNDIRYWLNGLHIETNGREICVVATDGHRLNVARIKHVDYLVGEDGKRTAIDPDLTDIETVILPAELVKLIISHKLAAKACHDVTISTDGPIITATFVGGVQYSAGAIDGTYPDWRRAVPDTISGEPADYNPEYVIDALEACGVYVGMGPKKRLPYSIAQNGTSAGGIFFEDFACVIMPWRADTNTEGMAEIKAPLTVKTKSDGRLACPPINA